MNKTPAIEQQVEQHVAISLQAPQPVIYAADELARVVKIAEEGGWSDYRRLVVKGLAEQIIELVS